MKRKPTIEEVRERRGIMKKAAAASIPCSYPTYRKYEENPKLMTVEQLDRLCSFLGVKREDIFLPTSFS